MHESSLTPRSAEALADPHVAAKRDAQRKAAPLSGGGGGGGGGAASAVTDVAACFSEGTTLKLVLVKALEVKNIEGLMKTLTKLVALATKLDDQKLRATAESWLARCVADSDYDPRFHNAMYASVAGAFNVLVAAFNDAIPHVVTVSRPSIDSDSRSKVVQLFMTEMFSVKTKILEGIEARSVQTVLSKAHKLKNSARLIGAIRVQSIACDIEAYMRVVKRGEGIFDPTPLLECVLALTLEAAEICELESTSITDCDRKILEQSTMGDVEFSRQMMSMFCAEVMQVSFCLPLHFTRIVLTI